MSPRKFPRTRSIERRAPTRDPKFKIIVVCEGEVTEPRYLTSFARFHGNGLVDVIAIPKGGVPVTLVNKAIAEKENLRAKARREGNSFDSKFEVWGLFDVDNHPRIQQAKATARANGINLAISHPCFELWGVLHFAAYDAPIDRGTIQTLLRRYMPSFHHDNNPIFDFEAIKGEYETAKENAIFISRRREEEGTPGGNPSTNVYELLDRIVANGRIKKCD